MRFFHQTCFFHFLLVIVGVESVVKRHKGSGWDYLRAKFWPSTPDQPMLNPAIELNPDKSKLSEEIENPSATEASWWKNVWHYLVTSAVKQDEGTETEIALEKSEKTRKYVERRSLWSFFSRTVSHIWPEQRNQSKEELTDTKNSVEKPSAVPSDISASSMRKTPKQGISLWSTVTNYFSPADECSKKTNNDIHENVKDRSLESANKPKRTLKQKAKHVMNVISNKVKVRPTTWLSELSNAYSPIHRNHVASPESNEELGCQSNFLRRWLPF